MSPIDFFADRLGVQGAQRDLLERYTTLLANASGDHDALARLQRNMEHRWETAQAALGIPPTATFEEARARLEAHMQETQATIYTALGEPALNTVESWTGVIEQMVQHATPQTGSGFFLRPEVAQRLLEQLPPQELLDYFGYETVHELLEKQDIFELMCSLRFAVSGDWNDRFLELYATLTPADFEERDTRYVVMDPAVWFELAKEFARKKLHPLSHLKEMGVVFAIPNAEATESVQGMIATLASLVMHYHYEVHFYARYMQRIATDRADEFGPLLQQMIIGGIVQEELPENGVRITHQYYTKKDNPDPRVFEPHVMPEPLHWHRGRHAVHALLCSKNACPVDIWSSCYTVGVLFNGRLLSLNYEDNVVIAEEHKTYHLFEALWNEIYAAHFSMDQLEESFLQHLDTGLIPLTT